MRLENYEHKRSLHAAEQVCNALHGVDAKKLGDAIDKLGGAVITNGLLLGLVSRAKEDKPEDNEAVGALCDWLKGQEFLNITDGSTDRVLIAAILGKLAKKTDAPKYWRLEEEAIQYLGHLKLMGKVAKADLVGALAEHGGHNAATSAQ